MPIHVICPGCKKRFSVSERFAGQKGPCPSCKTEITIPGKGEEVVIHAPEGAGPKDSKGQAVLKPILREETKFSMKLAAGIGAGVVVVLILALVTSQLGDTAKLAMAILGTIGLAPPLVWAAYEFLRSSELEPYRGKALWIRVLVCAAVYAVLWGVYQWIAFVLEIEQFEVWQAMTIAAIAVVAGGFAAYASFDLDFTVGMLHYAFYLFVTVVLALMAGISVL